MKTSESIAKLAVALSKFQGEVPNPSNTATNPYFKSKYAPLETVLSTVKPVLAKHGLSVAQIPSTEENYIIVTTILMHESGEYIQTEPLKLKMDKVTAQGAGSAITYARRYSLSAVLGIASEDDDDGNAAEPQDKPKPMNKQSVGKPRRLSEGQIGRLYAIANSKNIDSKTVKEQVKVRFKKEVEDLTRPEYDSVCKGYENMEV